LPLFTFDNSYARLPERFYAQQPPASVPSPRLIAFNHPLARAIGMQTDGLDDAALAAIFSGNRVPEGAAPLAQAYAGHQFGHFSPQLGDGRALLLGEVIDQAGHRRDIQLKGSGQTLYSRRGDGKAALGPVMREYIVSEAMQALGIRTTRSLAAVLTGETVYREVPLPGAVLTRVAASHIRIGTFEFFARQGDWDAVRTLADYAIERHYPAVKVSDNTYLMLLEQVIATQAKLVASWMGIGFIHGVMNTDNMAISGETIDYGPCAFMDYYDPMMVFSSIDRYGRYAYSNQPPIAHWNLTRFAETLLPLLDADMEAAVEKAETALSAFPNLFELYWLDGMRAKLGLETPQAGDHGLITAWLDLMYQNETDFTLAFRQLCFAAEGDDASLQELFPNRAALAMWLAQWRDRLDKEPQSDSTRAARMRLVNPAFIPRNHRIEQAITAAIEHDDFSLMHQLIDVLAQPYVEQPAHKDYALPPTLDERVRETFCGT
jgi:uncharacterized protein YdiU (UPF0061 family)